MERILVIEDNPAIAQMLAESWLPLLGYQARAVPTAAAGQAALRAEAADLVLLDLQQPDGQSLEHLVAIRQRYPDIAVILLLTHGAERIAVEAFRRGARDYLMQPFTIDQLRQVVEQALRERRLQREKDALAAGLRQRVQELTALNAIGRALTTVSDLDTLLTEIVESAIRLSQAEEGFLLLHDSASDQLRVRAARTIGDARTQLLQMPAHDTVAGQVIRTRQPLRLARTGADHPLKLKTGYLVRALLVVPLVSQGQTLGVLGVDNVSSGEPFTAAQERLLLALADYAAIALENARLLRTSQRSETRYRDLFMHASDLLFVLDRTLRLVEVNAAGPRLLGYPLAALIGQPLQRYVAADDWPATAAQLQQVLARDSALLPFELDLRRADDTPLRVELSTRRVLDSEGQPQLFCAAHDLTERLLLQAQTTHAEKLAALEQVVAGVAHELNNPLASITGYTQLLLREVGLTPEVRQDLERVLDQAQRAGQIVQGLLNFGRSSQISRTAVNLSALIASTLELQIIQMWPATITIIRELAADLPSVAADPYQLQQVMLNLLDNARRAMQIDGGTLTMRTYYMTDVAELPEQVRRGPCAPPPPESSGPLVIAEISDTGIGIPAQQLRSIFDPFWTTKSVGEGPGLGLSVCYGIIAQHHGYIWVCSTESYGTTVYVGLPPRASSR